MKHAVARTAAFWAALFLIAAPFGASAEDLPISAVPINEQTQIFCRDNTGVPVLQTYSNLGRVMRRYQERFQFHMSVEPGPPLKVLFSDPANTPYQIVYSVQPYRDDAGRAGILLLSMHLFLDNADREVTGPAMCYFTEFGK